MILNICLLQDSSMRRKAPYFLGKAEAFIDAFHALKFYGEGELLPETADEVPLRKTSTAAPPAASRIERT